MNLKKLSLAALSLSLTVGLLAGCAGGTDGSAASPSAPASPSASSTPSVAPSATPEASAAMPEASAAAVKTGMSVESGAEKSKNATAEKDGQVQTNALVVAVTVDDAGVIDACVIDGIQCKMNFNAKGELTTDPDTMFQTKNELGEAYGMKKASAIGKEWNEQAAAFAAYAVGKTVDELKGIAVDADGKATDTDLASSVSVALSDFIPGIEAAVKNATHMGAQKGDKLGLSASTNMSKSKNAAADKEGQAQSYSTMAAVTTNGDTITSCYINSVQATVKFNAAGEITTDLSVPFKTKNELGDDYGMRKASAIGKEWNEQAAAFCAYVTGKTLDEVKSIAVTDGKASDADLAASVTVGIGEFQELVEKAAK